MFSEQFFLVQFRQFGRLDFADLEAQKFNFLSRVAAILGERGPVGLELLPGLVGVGVDPARFGVFAEGIEQIQLEFAAQERLVVVWPVHVHEQVRVVRSALGRIGVQL